MLISLDEEIKRDKQTQYRRWRNERKDYSLRKRHEDYHTRRNYHFRANAHFTQKNQEERISHQQQKQFIKISNLHYEVTKDQLEMIFSQCGKLKTCRIDWDKMGRSKETATVEYYHKEDEERALKQLNNQILQGQTIKMELICIQIPNKKHEIWKQHNTYRAKKQSRK